MNRSGRIAGWVAVLLIYFIIVISFSLPILENLTSGVLGGENVDTNGHIWYYWFAKKCVLNLDFASLCHTNTIAYPSGKNLILDLGFPFLGILSILFQIALKFPLYYNIFIITILAFNGLSGYLLLNYMFKDAFTALIGGIFLSINPYVFYQVNTGRIEQAAIFWIPLFILSLFKIKNEKNKKYLITAALLLTATCLSYWYYGVFLYIFTALLLSYSIPAKNERDPVFLKNTLLLMFSCALFVFLILAYPVLIKGIYPAGYVGAQHSLNKVAIENAPAYFHYMATYTSLELIPRSFLILSLIIIILSLLNKTVRKNYIFYIISAFFFFILSIGPRLFILGHSVNLPYIWFYQFIPFFDRLWWPINAFSMALVFIMIAMGALVYSLRSKPNIAIKFVLPALLTAIYLFTYYRAQYNIPPDTDRIKASPFMFSKYIAPNQAYDYLKRQPSCAIIELPFEKGSLDFLYHQTIHEQKVFNCPGYAIKDIVWPKEHLQYLYSNNFLRYLDLLFSSDPLQGKLPTLDFLSLKTGMKQLYTAGFRFILVSPRRFSGYRSSDLLLAELIKILKEPYRKFPDGVLLYKVNNLAHE